MKIRAPHYFAGREASIFSNWEPISPGRMSYEAGYRFARLMRLKDGNRQLFWQFK